MRDLLGEEILRPVEAEKIPQEELTIEPPAEPEDTGTETAVERKRRKKKEQHAIRPALHGREPLCKHFGICGGCEYQHVPYIRQTTAKVAVFQKLVARQGLAEVLPLKGLQIVSSPQEYGYRQRMDYVFAFDKAGLRERGSHKFVVALEECPLLGQRGFAAFNRAVELATKAELPCYNYLRNEGFLRYFVIRQSRDGGILLSLVTKSTEYAEEVARLAETLLAEKLVRSVYWLLQDTISDVSFGEPVLFWGAEFIEEAYADKRFLIGPNTFFQANPAVAEQAYGRIAEYAAEISRAAGGGIQAIDAYSGTGVIAQLICSGCGNVAAVENVPDNIRLARENLRNNNIENVTLYEEDAAKFLAAGTVRPDLLIVNPPRSGMGPKAVAALRRVGAPRLAYMSCNPVTLLEDLRGLLGMSDQPSEENDTKSASVTTKTSGFDDHAPARPKVSAQTAEESGTRYRVTFMQLYDMFPQTRHWETLVFMEADDTAPLNL